MVDSLLTVPGLHLDDSYSCKRDDEATPFQLGRLYDEDSGYKETTYGFTSFSVANQTPSNED